MIVIIDKVMNYTPSVNIEKTAFDEQNYIITQNARCVVGNIINSFNSGIHSFNIIGSYGTGKSSFILAFKHSLENPHYKLTDNIGQFNGFKKFKLLPIVGEYESIKNNILKHLPKEYSSKNLFEALSSYYDYVSAKDEFLFIAIDEFGKILEYASKNNPEKELYTLQQLAEFVNDSTKNIILLTTLHQNFSSYSKGLSESQRNEWIKVKGRFGEIVFNEPVEQLLHLAASRLEQRTSRKLNISFKELYDIAKESKFISATFEYEVAEKLYPLDMFAAQALTLAIQRYGQNERTLFSFLESYGSGSLKDFTDHPTKTYNLANVYDYIAYNFYSYLSEVNSDSSSWSAMRIALEKVEGFLDIECVSDASKIIKSIGLLNLFGSAGTCMSKDKFCFYVKNALGIDAPKTLLTLLENYQIIRYAKYKSQYVIFDGTDVNIEEELLQASGRVPRSKDIVSKLAKHFDLPFEFANSAYFQKGTPRYFEYTISEEPSVIIPANEIDGYINLIFNKDEKIVEKIIACSSICEEAMLYAYFKKTDTIIDHIWEIDKLENVLYLSIDDKDTVAKKELNLLLTFEKEQLNRAVLDSLFSFHDDVIWIHKGKIISIKDKTHFNKLLSIMSNEVYSHTPIFINEMVNKHKPSGSMSLARVKYLEHLLENYNTKDLGFDENKFPPEKTIYKTLLQNTNIHRSQFGVYDLVAPEPENSFFELWEACEAFMRNTSDKPKKIGELSKVLKSRPLKLKQGFIDLWLPTYLIMKRNDYSLYDSNGTYIPVINREVLDILQRNANDFSVKAFNVDGVKLNLFNQYRKFVGATADAEFSTNSLIETIRPFLVFYKKLDKYTKHTKKLNKSTSIKFRDVIANAKDPEKTFFEDLPRALGFKESKIAENDEALKRYVELIQTAIRDLRSCYMGLIDRLENTIVDALNLKSDDFFIYQKELISQYDSIKTHLLTNKQKAFLNRVIDTTSDKKSWFESICYVVLDKKLDTLLDEEEEYLIDNLVFSFKDLRKYVDISKLNIKENDNFFRFELISKEGGIQPQIVTLSAHKEDKVIELENKINLLLSGDNDVEVYALLNILKKKMNHE